jgi:hypothetical protein
VEEIDEPLVDSPFFDVGVNIYIPGTVEEIDEPLVDSPKCTLTDVD